MATFDENGNYIKTNWKSGDRITASKLNKIEDSLEAINNNDISRHVETDARLDELEANQGLGNVDVANRISNLESSMASSDNALALEDYRIESEYKAADTALTNRVNNLESNLQAQIDQAEADMESMRTEIDDELDGLIADTSMLWNGMDINPLLMGAAGDGVADDTAVFNQIISEAPASSIINLHGRAYALTSDITLTKSMNIIDGTLVLNNATIKIQAGVSNCTFMNVLFNGVDKSKDGVSITYPSSDHRFTNCIFRNCLNGLKTSSDRDTEQRLYVNCCTFASNKFGIYSKDLKRHTIIGCRFAGNEIGYYSYTQDYHGLGLIFDGNYLNGNQQGIHLDNGLYDSVFCGNMIDHNNAVECDYEGCGMYMTNEAGRYYRNIIINANGFRNNGDYSFIAVLNGTMDYCNISNNTAHITGVKDFKIDYSNGHFSNNVIANNNFINGSEYIDNGTNINVNNAVFSVFQGGSIRGKTNFRSGIELIPNDSFLYTSNAGYIQYYNGGSQLEGPYIVMPGAQDSTPKSRKILIADWVQTANRPDINSVPTGFMIFDTTLMKPIWKGLNSKWYDATGAEV